MKKNKENKQQTGSQNYGNDPVLKSERGAVLVATVVLSAVALAVMVTMLYVVTTSTSTTRMVKQMRTSYEAALAGWDILKKIIDTQGTSSALASLQNNLYTAGLNPYFNNDLSCQSSDGLVKGFIYTKLKTGTSGWMGCMETQPIDASDTRTYDLSVRLGTDTQYNVFGKIVYTGLGNTVDNPSSGLDTSGGVIPKGIRQEVPTVPSMLTVEILATNVTNTRERTKLAVVYQF